MLVPLVALVNAIRGKLPIMGKQSAVETSFRERVQQERERRKWSRADLSKMLQGRGFEHIYTSTVAKIEYGERAVRIDEATAIADLFEVSVDAAARPQCRAGESIWPTPCDPCRTSRANRHSRRRPLPTRSTIASLDLYALEFEGREALKKE